MTIGRLLVRPPDWAEALLRGVLKPEDRDTVSGDLLEEYRTSVVPERGRGADAWYVRQVAGFLWRATWAWAVLFSGAGIARTAYDWFVPTTDFAARSALSTWVGVSVLFLAAACAAWRSRSFVAGPLVAAITSQVAAVMTVGGAAILYTIWHDAETRRAIAGSGGIEELFVLPFMMIIPALLAGTVGGAMSMAVRRLLPNP